MTQEHSHVDQRHETEHQYLEMTLNSLNLGVVICDKNGKEIFSNLQARKMFSTSYGDALAAKEFNDFLIRASRGDYQEHFFDLFGPPKRSFVAKATPLARDSKIVGFAATLEDISLKKQVDDVRRDFVANVSHELKTPIGAMQLLAETMSIEDDPEIIARLSARVEKEAIRLGRIVEDLLDLSRIESSSSTNKELTTLNEIIRESAARVSESASLKGIDLVIEAPAHNILAYVDIRQMISAVYNLLDNAIKYSDQDSQVYLILQENQEWISLSVRDSGIGIPPRDQERIFERFYRVDQNRSRITGGTGLGLSIVRHVVENHDGQIMVESEEGLGSTFTLRLPKENSRNNE